MAATTTVLSATLAPTLSPVPTPALTVAPVPTPALTVAPVPTPALTVAPVPTLTPLPTVVVPPAATVEADYVIGNTDDPTHLTLGETVFVAKCAGCHGTGGVGSDRGRSLIGIAAEEPNRLVHIDSVIYGKGDMLLRPGLLTPEEIDAVISYVRLSLVAEDD